MGDPVVIRIKLNENEWSKPWGFPFTTEEYLNHTLFHFGNRIATIEHSVKTKGKRHLVFADVGPGLTESSNFKSLIPNGGKGEEFLQFDGGDGYFYRVYHSEFESK